MIIPWWCFVSEPVINLKCSMKTCILCIGLDNLLFPTKNVLIFFLILHKNIYCRYSLDAHHGGPIMSIKILFSFRKKENSSTAFNL